MFGTMRKRFLFVIYLFCLLGGKLLAQSKNIVVCDQGERIPLEMVTVLFFDEKKDVITTAITSETGVVSLDSGNSSKISTLRFSRLGYHPLEVKMLQLADTVFLQPSTQLDEVEITAYRQLVKLKPGKLRWKMTRKLVAKTPLTLCRKSLC